MSNALAAYYTYLALEERERARVFRKFGYYASAQVIERRAERHEDRAAVETSRAGESRDSSAPSVSPLPPT